MIDSMLDATRVESLLAAAAWQDAEQRGTPHLVANLNPPRIIWSNRAAQTVFNASEMDRLSRLVFGSSAASRGMAGRLGRLVPGAPPHLERLLLSSEFRVRPVTVLCKAVDDERGRSIVFQVGATEGMTAATVLAAPRTIPDDPEPTVFEIPPSIEAPQDAVLDDDVIRDAEAKDGAGGDDEAPAAASTICGIETVAAEFASRFGRSRLQRFVWQTDAADRVTVVGPEMAASVGNTALRPMTSLTERLRTLAPEAIDGIADAIAQNRSWSGVLVRWPVEGSDVVVTIVLGGVPGIGSSVGYRGFGVVHLDQLATAATESIAGTSDRDLSQETVAVASGEEPLMDAAEADGATVSMDREAPVESIATEPVATKRPGVGMLDTAPASTRPDVSDSLGSTALDTARPTEDTPSTGAEDTGKPLWPLPGSSRFDFGSGVVKAASKVVHLAAFKSGTGQTSVPTIGRRIPPIPTDGAIEPDVPPRWSETPITDPPIGQEPAEPQLSSNERYNFNEIARTLAAVPPWSEAGADPVTEPVQDNAAIGQAEDPPAVIDAAETAPVTLPDDLSASVLALLDALPIGTLVVQGEQLIYANRTMFELLGFESLVAFRDAGGLKHVFQGKVQELTADSAAPQPLLILGRDGEAIGVDVRVQPIGWQGEAATLMSIRRALDREVSAQVEAMRLELQKSQATSRDLTEALDMAASGIGFLDMNGRILSINGGAERLFGYDQREVVGDRCAFLIAPDQQAHWSTFFNGFIASQGGGRTTAFRRFAGRKRNGDVMRLAASLKRIGADKICIVWNDDASRHVAENELELARRDAERASSLKSEFLAKVSHEIRTPLNAILGFTEIIVEERFGPVGNERYKAYLKDIHTSGTHVMSLINDLLDLSRIEAGGLELKPVALNPNAIVGECVATLQTQAHKERIIIRSSLAPRLPLILADERAVRQIVLNLLSNAVKFNEPGGQVIVSTAITETGAVAIRIRDTGLGMSEDEIETAMKPFRQLATPKANAGSGLGLPLTKALVDANQATMSIRSRPREGTLVEITFIKVPAAAVTLPAE